MYTHLHLHTEYSLLDGANRIKTLCNHVKNLGMKSVSMSDHGNMFGAIEFYKTMKKEGIKPIIGMEAYLHNEDLISSRESKQRFHLCLFAKNEEGYKNLMKLSSISFIDGFYYYPRINKKLLKEHSNGLVCTGACLQGEIPWHLNTQNPKNQKYGARGFDFAKDVAREYQDIFGDDFYIEIMRHGIKDQEFIDDNLIRISKETGIKLIATNDAHYTLKKDAKTRDLAMQIRMGSSLGQVIEEFYVKSHDEMLRLFSDIPEALANTQEIDAKCNLEINLKNEANPPTPPRFVFTQEYAQKDGLDPNISDADYFAKKARDGLEIRLKIIDESKHEIYKNRLEYEIDIINKMKFGGYMLIVWDFINYAKNEGIPVGPGRGSAAGSLVAFSLKITDIDPIKHDLLFERFLNPERVSMPDIDTDFCQRKREKVVEYVVKKYGWLHVAQVITFNSMLARSVIRDVARVLEMPLNESDTLAKLIPDRNPDKNKGMVTLKDAYEIEPKIREIIGSNPKAREVWDHALELEGLKRQTGKHAAAIVIDGEAPLWNKTPIYCASEKDGDKTMITQYSMKYLEEVDLIKFDFLGLKTLTMINDALLLIKKRYNKDIDFLSVDVNDKKVYDVIQSGDTLGIFQIESSMFQSLNKRLKPSKFEDIVATIALGRPGPMESGMVDDFINRKHGLEKVSYMFDELKPILSPTYGSIVYQEQVIQIVQTIGGFSLGEADLVRRAMGKKVKEEMDRLKSSFVNGADKNGFDTQKAGELWELIVKFAGYGFNKSHSAAYAMITFQTAYLKAYYKHEFMAALLSSESEKIESIAKYIAEVRALGISVVAPHVNISDIDFSVMDTENGDKKIVFGLSAINGMGSEPINDILQSRESGGKFEDLEDFISRSNFSKITKRSLEPLIKAGGLDNLGYSRACMLENIDTICEKGRALNKLKSSDNGLFAGDEKFTSTISFSFNKIEESPLEQLLDYEFKSIGVYVSGHPLDQYKSEINKIRGIAYTSDLDSMEQKSQFIMAVKIIEIKRKIAKSGRPYANADILDMHGKANIMLFEKHLNEIENLDLKKPLALKCELENDRGEMNLRLLKIMSLENARTEATQIHKKIQAPISIILKIPSNIPKHIFALIKDEASKNAGNCNFKIVIKDKKEQYLFKTKLKVSQNFEESLLKILQQNLDNINEIECISA